eukprot:Platyproteum_vivax@DN4872_c0_g1_i2.p1
MEIESESLCNSQYTVIHQGFETSVALQWDESTKRNVVVKKLTKSKYTCAEEYKKAQKEIEFLQQTSHPNILPLLYYVESKSCMLGDLLQTIQFKTLPEIEARKFAFQVLSALAYLHGTGIVHCDLKPKNILLFRVGDIRGHCSAYDWRDVSDSQNLEIVVRLCDLGLAERVEKNTNKVIFRGLRGTSGYLAPELLQSKNFDGGVDVWALGVMLYTIIGGYEPFFPTSACLKDRLLEWDERYWGQITDQCKDLLQKILVTDPRRRISAIEALQHEWFHLDAKDVDDLNFDILSENRSNNTSIESIMLNHPQDGPHSHEGHMRRGSGVESIDEPFSPQSEKAWKRHAKLCKRIEMESKLITPSMSASMAKIKFLQMWNP